MTYEIVDMDGGDVLAVYASARDAEARARLLVEQHPEIANDIVVVTIDADGHRVAETKLAAIEHAFIPVS